MDLIITILPVVTKDLPTSPRFTPYIFFYRDASLALLQLVNQWLDQSNESNASPPLRSLNRFYSLDCSLGRSTGVGHFHDDTPLLPLLRPRTGIQKCDKILYGSSGPRTVILQVDRIGVGTVILGVNQPQSVYCLSIECCHNCRI